MNIGVLGTGMVGQAFAGKLLLNCTAGRISLEVLKLAGEKNLNGKI